MWRIAQLGTKCLKVHQSRFKNFTICSASYKKKYRQNFAFGIFRIIKLFSHKTFAFFLNSRLLFNIFYCFCIFVNKQTFPISQVPINQKVNAVIMRNLPHIIYVKTKIYVNFQTFKNGTSGWPKWGST